MQSSLFYFLRTGIRVLVLFSVLGIIGCSSPDAAESEGGTCENLNQLIFSIRKIDRGMQQLKDWGELETEIQKVLHLLSVSTGPECAFRNHAHYPRVMRFMFVDQISRQLQYNRYPESFPYLLALGRRFQEDAEIREYFGEKLALIAYHNPELWVAYYTSHPAESDSLYRNTRWQITDRERLVRRLKSVSGSEALLGRLQSGN
jgi:hypothetical protein